MKRLLMASAAVLALAFGAPAAVAQYTTPPPATAPYTTPLPDDDPATSQDETVAQQPDTQSTQSQTEAMPPPGAPELAEQDPATTTPTEPYDQQAQTETDSTQAQEETDDHAMHAQSAQDETAPAQTATAMESPTTMASLEQHARDAGMDSLPMTAQAVCAPRDIDLTTSGSGLTTEKRRQLINAADRASVCDLQTVTLRSPDGRGEAARQTLIDNGVDASLIEVEQADSGGLGVELTFAGVATSSEQYAAMFNPQQLAMAEPSTTTPGAPMSQPSTPAPGAPMDDMSAPPPPDQSEPPEEEDEEAMQPTSASPTATSDMNDI